MEIKVNDINTGFAATYTVEQEDPITYNIRLRNFDGEQKPPLYIKLYKTELGWRSAFEDADLIRELGLAIDEKI